MVQYNYKAHIFTAITFFSDNALKCVSMNNQECRIGPQIISINSDKTSFCPDSIEINKDSSSCNKMNDPYVKMYVPDAVKNINVKVFNLISRINETRHIE